MSTLLDYSAFVSPMQSNRPGAGPHQSSSWQMWLAAPLSWLERRWQRNALRELMDDPRRLNDVGLTQDQVLREVNRAFWS